MAWSEWKNFSANLSEVTKNIPCSVTYQKTNIITIDCSSDFDELVGVSAFTYNHPFLKPTLTIDKANKTVIVNLVDGQGGTQDITIIITVVGYV